MRAGREVRVIVDPGEVDDEEAALIAHETAAAIEKEVPHPGRIKVTVIRESRASARGPTERRGAAAVRARPTGRIAPA